MKRGAEKQISKDDYDQTDEDDDEKIGTGFAKASDVEISSRKIRSLPKRAMGVSLVSTPTSSVLPDENSTAEQVAKPKFSGFSGFGSATANSSPFTFTAPTSSDSPSLTKSSPTLHSSSDPTQVKTPLPHHTTSSTNFDSVPKNPAPTPSARNDEYEDYNAAFNFYKSIRGLNVSFTSFLSMAVQEDPFVDVAQVFDQYSSKRRNIQAVWDKYLTDSHGTSSANSAPPTPGSGPSAFLGTQIPSPSPPKPSVPEPFMPTPPPSFEGFLKPFPAMSPSSSNETASRGGFTPTFDASKAPSKNFSFTFPSSSTTTGSSTVGPPAPTFALGGSSVAAEVKKPEPESAFATDSSSTSDLTPATKQTPLFSKGPSTTSIFGNASSAPNFFGNSSVSRSQDPAPTGSLFGSSSFGAISSDKPSNPFGFGSSTSSSTDKPATPTGTFGGFGAKPFVGFGNVSGGSGNGSGSIGNPVGFGFGSPPKTPPTAAESSSKSGFTFGSSFQAPSSSTSSAVNESSGPTTGEEGEEVDHAKILSPVSVHDREGEGEEEEDTTHSVKCKVYKLNKEEGGAGWSDMGIGILRVKQHKDTGSRRILLRNSSTGKLVINFNIHSGMKPSTNKQTVSFMGHDDQGNAAPFRLRIKTESAAQELKDVLDREVEFVKGKSD